VQILTSIHDRIQGARSCSRMEEVDVVGGGRWLWWGSVGWRGTLAGGTGGAGNFDAMAGGVGLVGGGEVLAVGADPIRAGAGWNFSLGLPFLLQLCETHAEMAVSGHVCALLME
jgi:hypothetical protein